jgi:peptide/nickel transport system substrate-binding protein
MRFGSSGRRRLPLLVVIVAGCAAIGAIPLAAAAHSLVAAAEKPTITIGFQSGAPLNPLKGQGVFPEFTLEPLLKQHWDTKRGQIVYTPGLATSWHYVGTGNKIFDINLRTNARFSTGEKVTGKAVAGWLNWYVSSKGATSGALGTVSSIKATGPHSLRIKLAASNNGLPLVLSLPGENGSAEAPSCVAKPTVFDTKTCGAGMYKLDPSQTQQNDHYTFVPNPYYYDESKIRFSKITAKVIPDSSSMLQALEAGQVQVLAAAPSTIAPAATAAGFHATAYSAYGIYYVLDAGGDIVKALGDVRVRQAINYALDRKAIVSATVGRYGAPAEQMFSTDGYNPKYAHIYPYDPAKAKSLLAAAGYANGFTLDVDTVDLPMQLAITQGFAKYLGAVGINVKIHPYDIASYWNQTTSGNDPAFIQQQNGGVLWLALAHFTPGTFFDKFAGKGWDDPILDSLYKKGAASTDPLPYFRQLMARYTTQAYSVPVLNLSFLAIAAKKVGGLPNTPNRADYSTLFLNR